MNVPGALGHQHHIMSGKHFGTVGVLPALGTQRLTARVAVEHASLAVLKRVCVVFKRTVTTTAVLREFMYK